MDEKNTYVHGNEKNIKIFHNFIYFFFEKKGVFVGLSDSDQL